MSEPSRPGPQSRSRGSAAKPLLMQRDGFLSALANGYASALGGHGAVALVVGERGIGKTSLINSWLEQLPESQPRASGRCYADEQDEPFAVWRRMARAEARVLDVLPEPLGRLGPPVLSGADLTRRAVEGLSHLTHQDTWVLTFDDLQWADARSLELVRALARWVAELPLMIVVGVTLPIGRALPFHGVFTDLVRLADSELIELTPLAAASVNALVMAEGIVHDPVERRGLVDWLVRLSNGNPLFVVELLRTLQGQERALDIVRDGGVMLPLSLDGLIEQRLSGLSESAVETLSTAALVGEQIDPELVAATLGRERDELVSELESSFDLGLLVEDSEGHVRFRHQIVQEALVTRQSVLRRRRSHAALLPLLRTRPGVPPAELARHAELAGDLTLAVEMHALAAAQASRFFAMSESARALERAVQLSERAGLDEQAQDRLLLDLADALMRLDRAQATRLVERVEARALVRNDRITIARSRQRHATMLYEAGRRSEAARLLAIALPDLEDLGARVDLADGLVTRGYCAASESDFVLVEQTAGRLRELADELSSPVHRAFALWFLAVANVARGLPDGAPEMGRESVAILSELGKLDLATPFATVVFMRVDLFANLTQPEMVADLVRMGEELDRTGDLRIGADPSDSFCTPEFCLWSFLTGDWERGLADLPDPEALANAPQPQVLKDIAHTVAAEFDLALGDLERGARRLHYIAPHPEAPLGEHSYQQWLMAADRLATLDLERGALEDARAWMSALDRALELKPHVPGELMLQSLLAELDLLLGNAQSAATRFEEVVERAKQTTNVLARLRGLRGLALSHYRLNRAESALRYAQQAVDMAEQSRLVYEAALSRLTLAEIGLALPTANGRYREVAIEAAATLRRLGATRALERAEALLEPRRRREGPLTTRELEIVELVAAGHTDNEIAERLYISRRTVNTHLTNIYAKTGIGNRVELVTWAISNGYVTPRG